VQGIVMVRDDFWLGVSRFLKELEVRLVEGENSALVDLFDVGHAKKVLAAFGRAFGKLPEDPRETSKEQNEFLEQAVTELSGEGKVVCVRLALFAEMMKSKAWTPGSLKAVGGAAGVGARFLEETFGEETASGAHRDHAQGARDVLKALLPESGTDIKGHMRSYQQLLEASGYASRPRKTSTKNFDDLLSILDGELRLITPADPEGAARDEEGEMNCEGRGLEGKGRDSSPALNHRPPIVAPRHYQLTHDYLVRSLRDWLNREEQATRRGRARLLLKDLASLYSARPENRQLPSSLQWVGIRLLTSKRTWTEPQRRMMWKASQHHAKRALILAVLLLLATLVGLEVYRANRAAELVQLLETADIAQVPGIVEEIAPCRHWANARLQETNEKAAPDSRQKLNTSIALLPVQPSQAEYIYDRLLDAELDFGRLLDAKPNVIRVILDFAAKYPPQGEYRDCILTRLVAEVGEQPSSDADEDAKEKLAKRQAKAAVALLRMDQPEQVWSLLKHRADPRVRSYLIHLMGPSGVDFKMIRRQLKSQSDMAIRRALLLSLGEFSEEDMAEGERHALVNDLLEWYADHPDPGFHGAVEWLLRLWKQDPWLKQTDEKWATEKQQREQRLESIRRGLAKGASQQPVPQWYVNSQGQTMMVIPGSVEFMFGSPPTEDEDKRLPDEQLQQRQRIGHHFAIAAKPVTFDQFQRFLKSRNPRISRRLSKPDCPVTMVSWCMAAEYCNWLSEQEGLQRCYEPNEEGKYEAGMKPAPDCLNRNGYRLPTEEEWECACRAGAMTSRYYGESVELLRKYGWYVENSGSRSWDVASLKPNDWGLFDMHGNVFSWCHNAYDAGKTEKHFLRGGSYVDAAQDVRAAHRHKSEADYSSLYIGLRPARTVR
jgi:formylglycine-generating enzyme required for sulfatase activity